MNCPSDDELCETLNDDRTEVCSPAVLEHVRTCEYCAEKIAAQRRLSSLIESTMAADVPSDVFLIAQSRIESHETRKRNLAISLAIIAVMLVCVTNLSWFTSTSHPQITNQDDGSATEMASPHNIADGEPIPASLATVTVGDNSLVVPLESESDAISIFMIYPTVAPETSDDSSSHQQPVHFIARS